MTCPALTSAEPMAWRSCSMLGAPAEAGDGSAMRAEAPSVTAEVNPLGVAVTAGKGELPTNGLVKGSLTGACSGRSIVASGPDADSVLRADSMFGCEALRAELQLPPVGPKGEIGEDAG